jgi:hypothetical protein
MTKVKLGIGVLMVAGLAVLWVMQHQARLELRQKNESLQQQLERAARLEDENERLSNLVAQAGSTRLTGQTAELLKLRREVAVLRQQTNELQRLQQENQQLRNTLTLQNAALAKKPPEALPLDVHPKESWAFAGFATPDATLQSLTWAMNQGKKEEYMASLTGGWLDEADKRYKDADFTVEGPKEIAQTTGFRVLKRDYLSDDEAVLNVFIEGENDQVDMDFKKIDGQWKYAGPKTDLSKTSAF